MSLSNYKQQVRSSRARGQSYLHDQCTVLVAVLVEGVEFCDGVVKCLLGQLAGFVRTVEDLVIKYGEVESQAEPDGVGRLHLGFADFKCVLVSLLRIVNDS